MTEKTKKEVKKTILLKIVLGAGIVVTYVVMGVINPAGVFLKEMTGPVFMGCMLGVSILTGFLAKRLGRSGAAWGIGTFFTGLIPSIVLLFLGKKKQLLIKETHEAMLVKKKLQQTENIILSIARKNRGKVTPAHVALEADISIEEAQKKLDELAKKGFVRVEVTEGGTLVYIVPEFSGDADSDIV